MVFLRIALASQFWLSLSSLALMNLIPHFVQQLGRLAKHQGCPTLRYKMSVSLLNSIVLKPKPTVYKNTRVSICTDSYALLAFKAKARAVQPYVSPFQHSLFFCYMNSHTGRYQKAVHNLPCIWSPEL